MKTIILTRWHILLLTFIWGLFFFLFSIFNYNRFQLLNIIGFPLLIFLPGFLTVIATIKLTKLNFWGYISLSIGFSILELMLVALLGNFILPLMKVSRPLEKLPLLIELFILLGILSFIAWRRVKKFKLKINNYLFFSNKRSLILVFFPLIFVALSVFGAIRLNNGGSNILTMIMLGGIGMYILLVVKYFDEKDNYTAPLVLFFISLALLFMTSLRGWFVTGHDIQSEYKVFELAKNAGIWNMATYRDAYNACISITSLPTIFAKLLSVSDPYVYKILFQIIFAITPGIVYLISRSLVGGKMAFLSGIYFIAFPTFFQDMPFLTRQEIAFLFYGLMLYIIFEKKINLKTRRVLFIVMGVGVILSHYSTTYTVLVIFGLTSIWMPLFFRVNNLLKNKFFFNLSGMLLMNKNKQKREIRITNSMVLFLIAISFAWTSLITDTGGNVANVLKETVFAVKDGFTEGNRSLDAISLVSFRKPNLDLQMADYINKVVAPARANALPGEYFDEQKYNMYDLEIMQNEWLPFFGAGSKFEHFDDIVTNSFSFLGKLLAKLIEIATLIGMIYVFYKRINDHKQIDSEYYMLAFFCLVFVALSIILPILSIEYGVFRALQQSMFILAPIIFVGSVVISSGVKRSFFYLRNLSIRNINKGFSANFYQKQRKESNNPIIASLIAILFFLYSTAFIPQLIGGNAPLLHLNNSGDYYSGLLVTGTEWRAINQLSLWRDVNSNNEIQSGRYEQNKIYSLIIDGIIGDISPGMVKQNSYVFLGTTNIQKQSATVKYNGDLIMYKYPFSFLDDNKNLIYNNGGARIYK